LRPQGERTDERFTAVLFLNLFLIVQTLGVPIPGLS
jgi:hypothetical protein